MPKVLKGRRRSRDFLSRVLRIPRKDFDSSLNLFTMLDRYIVDYMRRIRGLRMEADAFARAAQVSEAHPVDRSLIDLWVQYHDTSILNTILEEFRPKVAADVTNNLQSQTSVSNQQLSTPATSHPNLVRHDTNAQILLNRYTVYNMRRRGFTMEADALAKAAHVNEEHPFDGPLIEYCWERFYDIFFSRNRSNSQEYIYQMICYGSSPQTQQLSTPAVGGLPMTQQMHPSSHPNVAQPSFAYRHGSQVVRSLPMNQQMRPSQRLNVAQPHFTYRHGSPTVDGLAMSQQMHPPSPLNVVQYRHGSPVVGNLPMNLQMHPSTRLNMPQPSFVYRHESQAVGGLAMSQQMHHSPHLHVAPLPQLSLTYRHRSRAVGEFPMNQQVHRPNVTPFPQQSVVPVTSMDPGTVSHPSKRLRTFEAGSSSRSTPSSHEESGN